MQSKSGNISLALSHPINLSSRKTARLISQYSVSQWSKQSRHALDFLFLKKGFSICLFMHNDIGQILICFGFSPSFPCPTLSPQSVRIQCMEESQRSTIEQKSIYFLKSKVLYKPQGLILPPSLRQHSLNLRSVGSWFNWSQ